MHGCSQTDKGVQNIIGGRGLIKSNSRHANALNQSPSKFARVIMSWFAIGWKFLSSSFPGLFFPCSRLYLLVFFLISSFQEWANAMARRPSSVNLCANRFFAQTIGRIATKLAHDGLRVSMHPGCAQGHVIHTFLDSWNELLRHWRSGFISLQEQLVCQFNIQTHFPKTVPFKGSILMGLVSTDQQ